MHTVDWNLKCLSVTLSLAGHRGNKLVQLEIDTTSGKLLYQGGMIM
jgi:hypothetical protein